MPSTPTTSALRTTPVRIIAVAVDKPYRKLVHAVLTSIAAAFVAPMSSWIAEAVLGTCASAEHVPSTTRSMSLGSMPEQASARIEATCDSVVIGTCDTRRSLIPVRVVIHSSVVSMKLARPGLSSTAGGMHLPQPVMAAYVMAGNHTPGPAGGYTARRLPGLEQITSDERSSLCETSS